MNQRKNESDADYKARRAAYDAERSKRSRLDAAVAYYNSPLPAEPAEPAEKWEVRSRMLDADGEIKSQRQVLTNPSSRDEQVKIARMEAIAAALQKTIVPVKATPAPIISTPRNTMVGYGIGDHHMGMLAWAKETGASYDLDIGSQLLTGAFNYFKSVVPSTEKAAIVVVGDFLHYDSMVPLTSRSGHILDADGRAAKMIEMSIEVLIRSVTIALSHHRSVHVVMVPGNHDDYSTLFLVQCIKQAFRAEPRVTVDTTPRPFKYFRHGRVLVGVNHGHEVKPEALPGIMAHDRAEDWGTTTYRYWWTGHVHNRRAWDLPGCEVESFRILPPGDAWSVGKGFRAARGMNAIVLHDMFGEITRYPVKPEMLEVKA